MEILLFGPIFWGPDIDPPSWLEQLNPNRKTLYFTMGSTGFARFFQQAVDIFGNTDYQCLMTIAGMAQLSNIPPTFS